jgi:hypothetical protein
VRRLRVGSSDREAHLYGHPGVNGLTPDVTSGSKYESINGLDSLRVETVGETPLDASLTYPTVGPEEDFDEDVALRLVTSSFFGICRARAVEDDRSDRRSLFGEARTRGFAACAEVVTRPKAFAFAFAEPLAVAGSDSSASTGTVRRWSVRAERDTECSLFDQMRRKRRRLDGRGNRKRVERSPNRLCGCGRDRIGERRLGANAARYGSRVVAPGAAPTASDRRNRETRYGRPVRVVRWKSFSRRCGRKNEEEQGHPREERRDLERLNATERTRVGKVGCQERGRETRGIPANFGSGEGELLGDAIEQSGVGELVEDTTRVRDYRCGRVRWLEKRGEGRPDSTWPPFVGHTTAETGLM